MIKPGNEWLLDHGPSCSREQQELLERIAQSQHSAVPSEVPLEPVGKTSFENQRRYNLPSDPAERATYVRKESMLLSENTTAPVALVSAFVLSRGGYSGNRLTTELSRIYNTSLTQEFISTQLKRVGMDTLDTLF